MVRAAPWESEWIESPRWVRVRFGGEWLASSKRMMLLRQHGFLPVYYFPAEDVRTDLLVPTDYVTESPYKGIASYWDVVAGERVATCAAWSYLDPRPGSPETRGYSFDWHSMDAWYEESERLAVPRLRDRRSDSLLPLPRGCGHRAPRPEPNQHRVPLQGRRLVLVG